MTCCQGRPGLNPRTDFWFFFRIAVNLFSLGVWLFLITCNRTMHTHPSSFQFPSSSTIVKFINCKLTMYQEKGTIYPKRGRERPILKTHHTTAIDLLSFRLPKSRPCNTLASIQPRVQSKRDGQFSRDNIFFCGHSRPRPLRDFPRSRLNPFKT